MQATTISAIGSGVYFLANQSKQIDANENSNILKDSSNHLNNTNTNSNGVDSNSNKEIFIPSTSTPSATPNKIQLQRKFSQYVSTHGGGLGGNREKIYYGDLDNDGDDDAASSSESFTETGHYTFNLIIFRNNNGTFDFVISEAVSGSGFYPPKSGAFRITAIKDNKIYAITSEDEELKENIQKTQYALRGNKLVEK